MYLLQVLFADGTVSVSQDSGPVWVPDSDLVEEKTPQDAEGTTTGQTGECTHVNEKLTNMRPVVRSC